MCCCRNMAQFFFRHFRLLHNFAVLSNLVVMFHQLANKLRRRWWFWPIIGMKRGHTTYTTKGTIRRACLIFSTSQTLKKHDDEHEKSVVFFTSFFTANRTLSDSCCLILSPFVQLRGMCMHCLNGIAKRYVFEPTSRRRAGVSHFQSMPQKKQGNNLSILCNFTQLITIRINFAFPCCYIHIWALARAKQCCFQICQLKLFTRAWELNSFFSLFRLASPSFFLFLIEELFKFSQIGNWWIHFKIIIIALGSFETNHSPLRAIIAPNRLWLFATSTQQTAKK